MDTWLSDFRTCSVAIEAFTSNTYCMLLSNDLRAGAFARRPPQPSL